MPDGVSCAAVNRLSTSTLPASVIHPLQARKEPGQRAGSSLSSQKPTLRPTHFDAQTGSARSAEIPRSPEPRNPRSEV